MKEKEVVEENEEEEEEEEEEGKGRKARWFGLGPFDLKPFVLAFWRKIKWSIVGYIFGYFSKHISV